jgi:hypothetical protein
MAFTASNAADCTELAEHDKGMKKGNKVCTTLFLIVSAMQVARKMI